jgi:hypothetical protein
MGFFKIFINMAVETLHATSLQIAAILMFAFAFSGCEKDDNSSSANADWFNGKLTAKIENGEDYDSQISKVWALWDAGVNSSGDLIGRILTECEFEEGKFSIDLPEIPDQFLMNIETFFSSNLEIDVDLNINNSEARLLDIDFFGISSANKYVDYFIYTTSGAKKTVCLFVYVDSNVTVKGGKNVNIKLKEGWNRIYWTPADGKVTSSPPSGLKWYLYNDI